MGEQVSPGSLTVLSGLSLEFGQSVVGHGTLDTPNDVALLSMINGSITGESDALPITLKGYIKGVGDLDNVVFHSESTYSPGLSPSVVQHGDLQFDADAKVELEIGGRAAGTTEDSQVNGHDQIRHTGAVQVAGDLSVKLINDFQPQLGDQFRLIVAEGGVTGTFETADLPDLPEGCSGASTTPPMKSC